MEQIIYIVKFTDGRVYCAADTVERAEQIIKDDADIYPKLYYHTTILYRGDKAASANAE